MEAKSVVPAVWSAPSVLFFLMGCARYFGVLSVQFSLEGFYLHLDLAGFFYSVTMSESLVARWL